MSPVLPETTACADSSLFPDALFFNAPLAGWLVQPTTLQIVAANQAATELSQYSTAEFLTMSFPDLFIRESRAGLLQQLQSHDTPGSRSFTARQRRKNGERMTVEVYAAPARLPQGNYWQIMAVDITQKVIPNIDIHDQKRREEQLQYYATIYENVSDIIGITDLDYRIQSCNKVAEEFFGIKAEAVKGHLFKDVIRLQYASPDEERKAKKLEEGIWKGEVSYVTPQGEVKYLLHTITYVYNKEGKRIGVMGVSRDITERKQIEEQLKKSEQFYRNLISDSANGVLLTDEAGCIRFCSLAIKTILGYEPEELTGQNAFSFVHPDDRQWAWESFQREVQEKPLVKSITVRLRQRNGNWLWCMVRGHNLLQNEHVNGLVIYFHDDTLRKKANDALKESETRFRNLIRDLQVGVLLLDGNGCILMSNKAIHRIFKVSEQALTGKQMWELFADLMDEEGNKIAIEERPIYQACHFKKGVNSREVGLLLPQSKERIWLLVNADPILDEEGNLLHVVCSFTDITDRKRLQQKLMHEEIRHQKLLMQATINGQERERREIGKELHDNIGQQLTTIKLYLDLAGSTASEPAKQMITLALKNMSSAINDVRQISRSLVPHTLQDLGLIESINEVLETVAYTSGLHTYFDYEGFVEGSLDEGKKLSLFRIVQEQCNNIIRHSGAQNIWLRLCRNEEGILLRITDDGKGFDQRTLRKGLGLANIKNRAEIFGGRVEITSAIGQGCTVSVFLPVTESSPVAG